MAQAELLQKARTHPHWTTVELTVTRLREAGHQALIAGGSVRDLLRGAEPHDFDVATSALPDEVAALFPEALDVGKAFGVMILPGPGFQLEIATFRSDGPYLDGRRPATVSFTGAREDAFRRDFTINALFWDPERDEILDFVDGRRDLQAGVIRAVGDPNLRFEEDKLRLLRAVRFAAQLGFRIEPLTLAAILRVAPRIHQVSAERVQQELMKLGHGAHVREGLKLLAQTGLWDQLFPEWDMPHPQSARDGSWQRLLSTDDRRFRGPEHLFQVLVTFEASRRSVLDGETRQRLLRPLERQKFSKSFQKSAAATLDAFAELRAADFQIGSRLGLSRVLQMLAEETGRRRSEVISVWAERAPEAERWRALNEVVDKRLGPARTLPTPWFSGTDLKAMNVADGPRMGQLLKELFEGQLENRWASRDEASVWLKTQVRR